VTPDRFGPSVFGIYPIDNVVLSANSFARSGRPYTSSNNANDVNGKRSPAEYNTNLRIAKNIKNLLGMPATLYLEVFNVFNQCTLWWLSIPIYIHDLIEISSK
jgi:hypothetical protein